MSNFFIRRPIVAIVIAILTVVIGVIMAVTLPIAQFPNIAPPEIRLQASYPGADAQTLEQAVAVPIEQQVSGVDIFVLPSDTGAPQSRPFDRVGFLLIAPAAAFLLYGLDHASGREGRPFLVSGAILGGMFLLHASRKGAEALIDLRLFRNPVFSIGAATQFLANGANYAGQMLVPLFLIAGCGISPAKAGWMLAPMGLGLICINPMLAFLIERLGTRALAVSGTIVAICGTLPFLWMKQNPISPSLVAGCMFARGAGQGAVFLPSISAAYLSVSRDQLPHATAASNIVQRFGGPIGSTIMAIVLSHSAISLSAARQSSFTMGFLALIGLHLIVLRSAGRLPTRLHSAA